ncbi:transposase, partial [Streptomyces sp. NPDC005236]|uniref:IS110 family transposase n=1 Tax=Streptomyces sp. NPDC005236 TaxID=3157028 RepID=UPI0033A5FFFD
MTALSKLQDESAENLPAGRPEVVLGVDTHKDVHVAAVVTQLGALLGTCPFPATAAGYRELLDWARSFGSVRRAGVEGTGSYGAALCRYLRSHLIWFDRLSIVVSIVERLVPDELWELFQRV